VARDAGDERSQFGWVSELTARQRRDRARQRFLDRLLSSVDRSQRAHGEEV
jgi:hypothetical protein